MQNRFEGCIFCNSYMYGASGVLALPLEEGSIPVHMPSLWSFHSTTGLYQSASTTSGVAPPERGQMCDISRRPPYHGQVQTGSGHSLSCCYPVAGIPRIPCKLHQIRSSASTRGDLPGSCHQLKQAGVKPSLPEVSTDQESCQRPPHTEFGIGQRVSTVYRQTLSNGNGHSTSSPPLQKSTAAQTPSSAKKQVLRQADPDLFRGQRGSGMVVEQCEQLEWQSSSSCITKFGVGDGCFSDRMGGLLSGRSHRRSVVTRREEITHQRARASGSSICTESLFETCAQFQCPPEERQCDYRGIHKPPGRNEISYTGRDLEGTVGMVPPQRHSPSGSAPARQVEYQCRFHVSPFTGQDRLDAQSSNFQGHQPALGPSGYRSICNQILTSIDQVLQLASRSRGRGNGCFFPELGEYASLCPPSLVPHWPGPSENPLRGGHTGINNTMLANSGMVPSAASDVNRPPISTARSCQESGDHAISQLRLSGSDRLSSIGRMESLREQFRAEAIPEGAISLIFASWRDKTNSTYNSAWRKWERWCASHDTNPFSANIANILQFLTEEFKAGREYRSLNCYRSAISSTHQRFKGLQSVNAPWYVGY